MEQFKKKLAAYREEVEASKERAENAEREMKQAQEKKHEVIEYRCVGISYCGSCNSGSLIALIDRTTIGGRFEKNPAIRR